MHYLPKYPPHLILITDVVHERRSDTVDSGANTVVDGGDGEKIESCGGDVAPQDLYRNSEQTRRQINRNALDAIGWVHWNNRESNGQNGNFRRILAVHSELNGVGFDGGVH